MNVGRLIDRIEQRLEATDQTARSASMRATGKPDTIRGIARNPDGNPRADTLKKLAEVLECDLNWLMTGQVPDKKPGLDEASGELIVVKEKREIPVIGQVEAGVWREHLEPDDEDYKTVSYYDDHLTRGMNLVAIKVAGNSYNRIYPPGTVVVVALLSEIGRDVEHSDVCIVQRRSKEGLYEYTLKQLIVDADGNRMLWPNSLDPRYQTPIEFNPTGEDDEIQITGIVIRAITTTDRRLATDFI